MDPQLYRCSFCAVVKCGVKKYLHHLQLFHQNAPNFVVNCGLENCRRTYHSVAALKTHYYRRHRDLILTNPDTVDDTIPHIEQDGDSDTEDIVDGDADNANVLLSVPDLLCNLKSHVALFILQLQEKHVLPRIVQQTVVDEIRFLFNTFLANYSAVIKFHLVQAGFDFDDNNDLQNLLQNENIFDTALDCVSSDYKLESFCKNTLGFIEPVEYCLGVNENNIKESVQYVPILDVLKQLYQREELLHMCSVRLS